MHSKQIKFVNTENVVPFWWLLALIVINIWKKYIGTDFFLAWNMTKKFEKRDWKRAMNVLTCVWFCDEIFIYVYDNTVRRTLIHFPISDAHNTEMYRVRTNTHTLKVRKHAAQPMGFPNNMIKTVDIFKHHY